MLLLEGVFLVGETQLFHNCPFRSGLGTYLLPRNTFSTNVRCVTLLLYPNSRLGCQARDANAWGWVGDIARWPNV